MYTCTCTSFSPSLSLPPSPRLSSLSLSLSLHIHMYSTCSSAHSCVCTCMSYMYLYHTCVHFLRRLFQTSLSFLSPPPALFIFSLPFISPSLLQLPSEFFLELSKALNTDDKWAMAGSLLKLLTFQEIESLRAKHLVDKGAHVLHLWTDSHLTYQDLINVLNSKSVRLDRYIPHVEALIKSHLSSS